MRLWLPGELWPGEPRPLHLGYCTNIHPAHTLDEVRRALIEHTSPIAQRVSPDAPCGVGLRLSALAASELSQPGELDDFATLLRDHNLYVFTLNGFVHGAFHGSRVKQTVYRPDFRARERVRYTLELAALLSALAPEDVDGTISTVPGGFRRDVVSEDDQALVAQHLLEVVIELHALHELTGRHVSLAIEPEPRCQLENLAELRAFLASHLLTRTALQPVVTRLGFTLERAEALVRSHLGVCLDVCHAAVEHEDVVAAIAGFHHDGLAIKKVQLSNALSVERVDAIAVERLRAFADDVYLHQVVEHVVLGDGVRAEVTRYEDLPEAIASFERSPELARQWRVHFHVPLYAEPEAPLGSTAKVLDDTFTALRRAPFTQHLEVETYTWDVLPPALRHGTVNESVVRELKHARARVTGETT